jgi:hypothetical protein
MTWRQARFALLTQHGKEALLGPLFFERFEATVERATGFDTDTLGTFTGEQARPDTQLATARRKATLASELSGLPRGLGSEGASAPGPLGFGAMGLELVTLVDLELGLEVTGRASGVGHHHHGVVREWAELEAGARAALFPSHGLCLGASPRASGGASTHLRKGLTDWAGLQAAFDEVKHHAEDGAVFYETELRAHLNPTRQTLIVAATRDLLERMSTECPACHTPGFGVVRRAPGLPCSECGTPTNDVRGDELGCIRCDFKELRPVAAPTADPRWCPACNP